MNQPAPVRSESATLESMASGAQQLTICLYRETMLSRGEMAFGTDRAFKRRFPLHTHVRRYLLWLSALPLQASPVKKAR